MLLQRNCQKKIFKNSGSESHTTKKGVLKDPNGFRATIEKKKKKSPRP